MVTALGTKHKAVVLIIRRPSWTESIMDDSLQVEVDLIPEFDWTVKYDSYAEEHFAGFPDEEFKDDTPYLFKVHAKLSGRPNARAI